MDDVSESLKETIKTRLSNPLWGYIALSWLGFNWQNIAILFMSNEPVQFRIMDITSKDHFYIHHLIAPIVVGFLLAIISPYLQLLIVKTHRWAQKRKNLAAQKQSEEEYDREIALSQKKAKAIKAKDLALAQEDTKIVEEKEKAKQAEFDTSILKQEEESLKKEISHLTTKISTSNDELLYLNKKIDTRFNFIRKIDKAESLIKKNVADIIATIENYEKKDAKDPVMLNMDLKYLISKNKNLVSDLKETIPQLDLENTK